MNSAVRLFFREFSPDDRGYLKYTGKISRFTLGYHGYIEEDGDFQYICRYSPGGDSITKHTGQGAGSKV